MELCILQYALCVLCYPPSRLQSVVARQTTTCFTTMFEISAYINSFSLSQLLPWLHPSSAAEIKTSHQPLENRVGFGGISCVPVSNVFIVSDLPQFKEYPAYFVTEVGCLIQLAASPSSLQC